MTAGSYIKTIVQACMQPQQLSSLKSPVEVMCFRKKEVVQSAELLTQNSELLLYSRCAHSLKTWFKKNQREPIDWILSLHLIVTVAAAGVAFPDHRGCLTYWTANFERSWSSMYFRDVLLGQGLTSSLDLFWLTFAVKLTFLRMCSSFAFLWSTVCLIRVFVARWAILSSGCFCNIGRNELLCNSWPCVPNYLYVLLTTG